MIPLIKSTFYHEKETKKALIDYIQKADHMSFGEQCEMFEQEFAQKQGRKECIMVNSGSSANLALIQALLNLGRLKPGDYVGFSAVTWSTNVMPLIQLGLRPVAIDVEIETLNISPRTLGATLKQFPLKALFVTHLLGLTDEIDSVVSLCHENEVLVLEDTCEALGSVYRAKLLGNFGLASTFSFYVGHHLSTIEGGAVTTDDTDLAEMLRLVRAHGWDRNLSLQAQKRIRKRHNLNSLFYSRYTFYDLGYNLRPTDIAGFLGRAQLPYWDEIVSGRESNFRFLASQIYQKSERFFPLRWQQMDVYSNFAIPLICLNQKIRDNLVDACQGKIEIRPIVGGNIAEQPFFKKYLAAGHVPTPNADIIHAQGFYVGNNPEMTKKDLDIIASVLTG